jgi:DNA-binding response OmpR family regulator
MCTHGEHSVEDKLMPASTAEALVARETATMNILIVDDEPTIRETCAEVAIQSGMKVTTVATAEEAVEVLENTAIGILLTDLMLPQSSGLELLKRVHDTHPTVPVIVLTKFGTIDSAVTATRLGAVDYVTKPFRIEEPRTRWNARRAPPNCSRKISYCASSCGRVLVSAG